MLIYVFMDEVLLFRSSFLFRPLESYFSAYSLRISVDLRRSLVSIEKMIIGCFLLFARYFYFSTVTLQFKFGNGEVL